MELRSVTRLGLALAAPVIAGAAYASGSDSFGGGLWGEQARYNRGKGVYAQRLACGDCPLAGKTLDKELARRLFDEPGMTSKLSESEREALAFYLKRRFKP